MYGVSHRCKSIGFVEGCIWNERSTKLWFADFISMSTSLIFLHKIVDSLLLRYDFRWYGNMWALAFRCQTLFQPNNFISPHQTFAGAQQCVHGRLLEAHVLHVPNAQRILSIHSSPNIANHKTRSQLSGLTMETIKLSLLATVAAMGPFDKIMDYCLHFCISKRIRVNRRNKCAAVQISCVSFVIWSHRPQCLNLIV